MARARITLKPVPAKPHPFPFYFIAPLPRGAMTHGRALSFLCRPGGASRTFSMGFKGPPFLLALKNPPGPVQRVLMETAEGTEPESDVLESLDFPELDGDSARRTVAFAMSLSGKLDS